MKTLFAALSGALALAQTMTIEEYEPRSTLVVPQHPVKRARYPFIDVHNHQARCLKPECVDKLVSDMDALNLRVMVNLSGGYGDNLKRAVDAQKGRHKDRLIVFANVDFRNLDDPDYPARAASQLEKDVKNGAQGLKIFKNFGMDLRDSKGQRVHVDDPRFDQVFELCGRLKIPVLIHTAEPTEFFQPQDKHNERWLELKLHPSRARPPDKYPSWETLMTEQHNLFARHPKTIFINAHLGWLGANLAELGRLMDKLPNMYTEIGAVLYELGRQPKFARQWFIDHQDRVLFGRDIWEPSEYYYYFRVLETATNTSIITASTMRSGKCTGSICRMKRSRSSTTRTRCASFLGSTHRLSRNSRISPCWTYFTASKYRSSQSNVWRAASPVWSITPRLESTIVLVRRAKQPEQWLLRKL